MGKEYREKFGVDITPVTSQAMREYCQRPGEFDEDGNPVYFTEQHHKDQCDVNKIIAKYDKTGLIQHVSRIEAQFGDVTGLEFKQAMDLVVDAKALFDDLPSNIRNRFQNNPEFLLRFMEDPGNRDEAISLGLIKETWTEETDGLGEHIRDDSERVEKPDLEDPK